jgi:hypothetical protein
MSRKFKKRVSSMSFSINRLYRRISTARPSTLITSAIAIAISVFLFGGGLYDIIVRPLPSYYSTSGGFLFLYPRLSDQFITDSMIAMILYSIGIIGLVVMYLSTKYAYKPRQAYMMFLVGVFLLFSAYILLEAAIHVKLTGG